MHPGDLAYRILDRVHAHVRKRLPECRERTISELTVLFGDLRIEIADILSETDGTAGDD